MQKAAAPFSTIVWKFKAAIQNNTFSQMFFTWAILHFCLVITNDKLCTIIGYMHFHSLSDDNILALSKLKVFADYDINMTKMV